MTVFGTEYSGRGPDAREQNPGAADAEGKRAQGRTLHKGAPLDLGHDLLPE